MKIENNKFFVVSLGDNSKEIVENREQAIKILKTWINRLTKDADIEILHPEIIEVDTSGEKWSLIGLSWNTIAIELMRSMK